MMWRLFYAVIFVFAVSTAGGGFDHVCETELGCTITDGDFVRVVRTITSSTSSNLSVVRIVETSGVDRATTESILAELLASNRVSGSHVEGYTVVWHPARLDPIVDGIHVLENGGNPTGESHFVVNLGAGHYHANYVASDPCLKLNRKWGWSGLLVDAGETISVLDDMFEGNPNVTVMQSLITPENILETFKEANVPEAPDVLKIDIDSFDCLVLAAILTRYNPKLIFMEVNLDVPPPIQFSVVDHSDFTNKGRSSAGFYGCSIAYADAVASRHGYRLVQFSGAEAPADVTFVREDLLPLFERRVNIPPNYAHVYHHHVLKFHETCDWFKGDYGDGMDCREMAQLALSDPIAVFNILHRSLLLRSAAHNGGKSSSFILSLDPAWAAVFSLAPSSPEGSQSGDAWL